MRLVPATTSIDADDNIGRGMDFALVTLVFLGLGWVLDRVFDTRPAFMIGCVVFAVVGQFVKMYYAYSARMAQLEAARTEERLAAPRASVVLEDLSHEPLHIPSERELAELDALADVDTQRDRDDHEVEA